MEKNKKMGTLLLTGLITGSMLGSGIIILPPIAYKLLGEYAIFSWLIILFLGGIFAMIFTNLCINFPGAEGVSNAIGEAFGNNIKLLTSYFLMFAVCTGPTAVLITAGEYLSVVIPFKISAEILAIFFGILCYFILLKNIVSVSKISLFLSIFIAIVLLAGSISTLVGFRKDIIFDSMPSINNFGKTSLILVWAIIGWEVIGNYMLDIKEPKKTIKKGVIASFSIVNIIYLLTVLALQSADIKKMSSSIQSVNLSIILIPIFGKNAPLLMALVTISLCIATFILFVGSVARLICWLASNNNLPFFLSKKSKKEKVPFVAITSLCLLYTFELILIKFNILSLEKIVSFANVFFICNALLGIFASMKLFKTKLNFISTLILSIILIILLLFSSKVILIIPVILTIIVILKNKNIFYIKSSN